MRCGTVAGPLGRLPEQRPQSGAARRDPRALRPDRRRDRRRRRGAARARDACRRGGGRRRRSLVPADPPGRQADRVALRVVPVRVDLQRRRRRDSLPATARAAARGRRPRRHHPRLGGAPVALPDDGDVPRRGTVEHRVPAPAAAGRPALHAVLGRLPPAGRRPRPGRLPRRRPLAPRHGDQPALAAPVEGRRVRARAAGHADRRALAQSRLLRPRALAGATTRTGSPRRARRRRACAGRRQRARPARSPSPPRPQPLPTSTRPGPARRSGSGRCTGRIEASSPPATLRARVQETVDVTITNESDVTWRWGKDARPPIRLAYSWSRDGEAVAEPIALRTVLPADLGPGASAGRSRSTSSHPPSRDATSSASSSSTRGSGCSHRRRRSSSRSSRGSGSRSSASRRR